MPELLSWPFPLPERLAEALGYPQTVAAFESPAQRARLEEIVRAAGYDPALAIAPPSGPRRFLALYWEPAGDELAWSDGVHSGAGQLNHWAWLEHLRRVRVASVGPDRVPFNLWLDHLGVDFGSSEEPATHALVLAVANNRAWIAPMALARRIVHQQRLEPEP